MYYSQFGEDRILERLFAGTTVGGCVEVGANNGIDGSTTLHFEQLGWQCVLVEPIPELCNQLRANRKARIFECAASSETGTAVLQVAVGAELAHAVSTLGGDESADYIQRRHGYETKPITISTRRLDDILEEAALDRIDFISIDVEGHELALLDGFSPDRWRPRILIVEDNSTIWDGRVSAALRKKGYVRFLRTGVNDWYAHNADMALASRGSRLGYFPSMVVARAYMIGVRVASPFFPILKRIPGVIQLRDWLASQKK